MTVVRRLCQLLRLQMPGLAWLRGCSAAAASSSAALSGAWARLQRPRAAPYDAPLPPLAHQSSSPSNPCAYAAAQQVRDLRTQMDLVMAKLAKGETGSLRCMALFRSPMRIGTAASYCTDAAMHAAELQETVLSELIAEVSRHLRGCRRCSR